MNFKDIVIDTLNKIPEYKFNRIRYHVDLRTWYNVKINGELMEWWACDDEIDDLKIRHKDDEIELIEIPLIESILN